jgi:hypothetical protein
MTREIRCRSSDQQPWHRGIVPFGAVLPFGPEPKEVPPQIGHLASDKTAAVFSMLVPAPG